MGYNVYIKNLQSEEKHTRQAVTIECCYTYNGVSLPPNYNATIDQLKKKVNFHLIHGPSQNILHVQ